jgi:hypothetical protein
MKIEDVIDKLEREKNSTRFAYLARVCQEHFGRERVKGSHHIFKTPWPGDPRINLQKVKGNAKSYQVEQVIQVLLKLQEMQEARKKQEMEPKKKKGESHVAE